jgi:carbon monoxide dehydrogenase subunit G
MPTSITCTEHIGAPQARVFDVFTDLRRAAGRVRAIHTLEVLTEGPIGRGTRFRETRTMCGKQTTETMEITAFDPPGSYTVEGDSCGAHYITRFTFTPEGGSTRVEMTLIVEARSLLARLFSPLANVMMKKARTLFAVDLSDLKRAAEAPDPAPGDAAGVR